MTSGTASVTVGRHTPVVFITDTAFTDTMKDDVTNVDVGYVTLDWVVLKRTLYYNGQDSVLSYQDTTNTDFVNASWSWTGSLNFAAGAFNNTKKFPKFLNYGSLPDTIPVYSSLVMTVSNYSDADQVEITLFPSNASGIPVIKRINNPETQVFFSATDLADLGSSSTCSIYVNFYNNNYVEFSGKIYNFRMNYRFVKQGVFLEH